MGRGVIGTCSLPWSCVVRDGVVCGTSGVSCRGRDFPSASCSSGSLSLGLGSVDVFINADCDTRGTRIVGCSEVLVEGAMVDSGSSRSPCSRSVSSTCCSWLSCIGGSGDSDWGNARSSEELIDALLIDSRSGVRGCSNGGGSIPGDRSCRGSAGGTIGFRNPCDGCSSVRDSDGVVVGCIA